MNDVGNVSTLREFWHNLLIVMEGHHGLDTHALPPNAVCDAYKKYQRMDDASVENDADIVDFRRGLTPVQKEKIVLVDSVSSELIDSARLAFVHSGEDLNREINVSERKPDPCSVYEHKDFDGQIQGFHCVQTNPKTSDHSSRTKNFPVSPPTGMSSASSRSPLPS